LSLSELNQNQLQPFTASTPTRTWDDNLLCHIATTNTHRQDQETLSHWQAIARKQAFHAAPRCNRPGRPSVRPAAHHEFWAAYDILTIQKRVTFTSQPGIPDLLIHQGQLAEQPIRVKATARYESTFSTS
jgi:hypothetical protein